MTVFARARRERFDDRRPRWWEIPEEPEDDPEYDRFGMMFKIDTLEQGWRDLINEYGFQITMKVRGEACCDLSTTKRMLQAWRRSRQV